MGLTQKREVPPEKVRKMILDGFRAAYREKACSNRAKLVAERIGITVPKLYEQIRELGIGADIAGIREEAGVSSSGRKAGASYACSRCGSREHNARSPSCPKRVE